MLHDTATITGEQRDAIYEFMVERLSRLPDLPLAIRHEDFSTARRLAREFRQDFLLLDDLGWRVADGRLEVALTMAPDELAETFERLRSDAKGALSESQADRESREIEEMCRARDQLILDAGTELLIELQALGRESA
jgi:hypothetical protein